MPLGKSITDLTWAVTGATGLLGSQVVARLHAEGAVVVAFHHNSARPSAPLDRAAMDVTDETQTMRAIEAARADVVIHTAAMTNVDACEENEGAAMLLNARGAGHVARAAARAGAKCVHISTDQLWDGTQAMTTEETAPCPINTYGRSKAAGEERVLRNAENALVIRTNFFGGATLTRQSASDAILSQLASGETFSGFTDVFTTPISTPDLINAMMSLVLCGQSGIFNVTGADRISKYEFARKIAVAFGYPVDRILPISVDDLNLKALRPRDMSLSSEKFLRVLGKAPMRIDDGIRTLRAETHMIAPSEQTR